MYEEYISTRVREGSAYKKNFLNLSLNIVSFQLDTLSPAIFF